MRSLSCRSGAHLGLGKIGLGLMQPVEGVVHPPKMPFVIGFTTGFGQGMDPRRDPLMPPSAMGTAGVAMGFC
jgi:hypothetical protein